MYHDEDKQTAIAAGLAVFLSAALLVVMIRLAVDATGSQVLGHYRYKVAPKGALVPLGREEAVKLRRPAARAFARMREAARADGVDFYPISGFRDLKDQQYYFFALKSKHRHDTRQRSHVCAPPGYSEHHTGYSVDIGDALRRKSQLSMSFTQTETYRWLRRNAARFHFEMSFPAGNGQRLAYEPWHWRYVGDMHSFRTFYKAKSGVTYASMFPVP